MVTYLDATTAPLRNTGQIRLYGAGRLCRHAQGLRS